MTMQIVETTKKTYLASEVLSGDGPTVTLKGAMEMDPESSARDVAEAYVEAAIRGELREVTQQRVNIEAAADAAEIGPLVELFQKLIPQAEKSARENATVREMRRLVRSLTAGGRKPGSKSAEREENGDDEDEEDDVPRASGRAPRHLRTAGSR